MARTSILLATANVQVVGSQRIIDLGWQNIEQVVEVFSQPLEKQLKWLAKHELIKNTRTCPDPACNGMAMSFRWNPAKKDGWEVICHNMNNSKINNYHCF